MEKVDLVLVGAEGVVESGGIINKVIVSFLHHSVNSGLLKFGFFEAFQASIWMLSSKCLLIAGNWAILSRKH